VLQEGLQLSDRPDLAALTGNARRVRVGDDVALDPALGLEVFPRAMKHPMRVDDRLWL